jgi:hypothetical protein
MWGGHYVSKFDNFMDFSRTEDLLGFSTYLDHEDFERDDEDDEDSEEGNSEETDWFRKAKFIGDNHSRWKHIDAWDEALEYFDWEKRRSVRYNGYLLNHTQKLAVNLGEYAIQSMFR